MVKVIRLPTRGFGDEIFSEGVTRFVPGTIRRVEPPKRDAPKTKRPAGTSAAGRLVGVGSKPSA